MKSLLLFCLIGIAVSNTLAALRSNTNDATIREATTYCEEEVPNYCVSTTCPQFCNALRSRNAKANCNSGCTKQDRCKLKPTVGTDSQTNLALDAQNRDQLWACIAERRDPNNVRTGRRETPWKQLRTPSFQRAVRP